MICKDYRWYEVGIPADETWWYLIKARSKTEARRIAQAKRYSDGGLVYKVRVTDGAQVKIKETKRNIPEPEDL